jgi:hypothetical protein
VILKQGQSLDVKTMNHHLMIVMREVIAILRQSTAKVMVQKAVVVKHHPHALFWLVAMVITQDFLEVMMMMNHQLKIPLN